MKQKEAFWKVYRHPETNDEVRTTIFEKETKQQKDGRTVTEAALAAAGFVLISEVDVLTIDEDVKG